MANKIVERVVYNTKRWKKFKASYSASVNHICERCGAPGRVLHHIVELTPENCFDPAIVYGADNVMLLCWGCHEQTKTRAGLAIRDDIGFDAEGNVVATGKRAADLPHYRHIPP